MKRTLRIAPNAEADLRTAFDWYEQCNAGLGFAFLQTVETKLAELARSPQLFRKRAGAYRLATTRRFPYGYLFYLGRSGEHDFGQAGAAFQTKFTRAFVIPIFSLSRGSSDSAAPSEGLTNFPTRRRCIQKSTISPLTSQTLTFHFPHHFNFQTCV